MKQGLIALIIGAFLFFGFNAFAAFTVPSPTGFVTDTTGKLSDSQKIALEAKLRGIETDSHNEIAVLIVPSLGGESIEDATQEVFNSWKVGKAGLDNGVLLVIAVGDRKDRIQTGKGVEGDLTDLQSHNILNSLRPYLRSNDIAGAASSAVDQINSTLESRKAQKADPGKGATFNAPVPQADTATHSNGGCQAAPVGGLGFGWLFMIGVGALAIGLFLRRIFRVSPKEVREIGEMTPSVNVAPCATCGEPGGHYHAPVTYASVPIVTVSQAIAPVVIPVVAPVIAPAVEEPPPRRYTPRYDLYDAPGVPSIAPGYPKSTTEKVAEAAVITIAAVAVDELIKDNSAPSYVNDVLPSPSVISGSAAYDDDSSIGDTTSSFGGGNSGGGGASNNFDSDTSLLSGVESVVSDIGDLFGSGGDSSSGW